MKQGSRTTERSHSRAMPLASFLCLCASLPRRADALLAGPRLATGGTFATSALLPRARTRLETTREGDDFATFNDFEEDGQELAREFYQELQNRQTSLTDSTVDGPESKKEEGGRNTVRTVTIRANTNRRPVNKRPTTPSPPPDSSPLLQLISFLSPPARPAQSAGLFSGSGTTVYSSGRSYRSGRSLRAEIEILETTMKNSEANKDDSLWDWDSPAQAEEAFKLVALALLALTLAYAAVDASGGAGGTAAMISWEDAAASFNDAMGLVTDATRAGSDMLVSVNNGDVFLGEEAAWLMRESAEWAASVGEAVRSVEDFVLC